MNNNCTECGRSLQADREMIYYKLKFLGFVIGNFQNSDFDPNDNDFLALQGLLYDIADEVYPEKRMPEVAK